MGKPSLVLDDRANTDISRVTKSQDSRGLDFSSERKEMDLVEVILVFRAELF